MKTTPFKEIWNSLLLRRQPYCLLHPKRPPLKNKRNAKVYTSCQDQSFQKVIPQAHYGATIPQGIVAHRNKPRVELGSIFFVSTSVCAKMLNGPFTCGLQRPICSFKHG